VCRAVQAWAAAHDDDGDGDGEAARRQAAGWRRWRRGLEEEEERVEMMGRGRQMGASSVWTSAVVCRNCSGGVCMRCLRTRGSQRSWPRLQRRRARDGRDDKVTVAGLVDGSSYDIGVCLVIGLRGTDGSDLNRLCFLYLVYITKCFFTYYFLLISGIGG
jgi:hypothetical protein